MDCYKEFANIYDKLISDDIDYGKWADIILKLCDEFKVNKKDYLDLGCGTGNITEKIASNFIESWAVDLSCDMLTKAEAKFRDKGIKSKFVCQDICQLNLNRKFNLITCCLDSTNYILDKNCMENYFKRVNNHLRDDGIFIFDINSYYKITNVLGNSIYSYDDEEVVYIWQNSLEDDVVEMCLTFFVKEGELYRRFDEVHSERAYKYEEISEMLNIAGLKIVKIMDNYENKNISDTTERIVFIVKKKDI